MHFAKCLESKSRLYVSKIYLASVKKVGIYKI